MAGKKTGEQNTKKVAGNAKKAEAAAAKAAAENSKKAAEEEQDWSKGAKSNAKSEFFIISSYPAPSPQFTRHRLITFTNREAEAAKKAEQARKKAEKDAILAEEDKEARAAPKNTKQAVKKTEKSKGLDLSQLDDDGDSKKAAALNATGIDNALDALSLTADTGTKIDRHPERRFKAAFAAYEERRLREMETDGSGQGLRQNQKREKIRKEFEKSEENPFNQASAAYDASKEELKELKEVEKRKIEMRLAEK